MTLTQFPKFFLAKNHDQVLMKKVWIFFPKMTLPDVPKIRFLDFCLDFFPKMTLAQFPVFGFFFQDSRIGVKLTRLTIQSCYKRLWVPDGYDPGYPFETDSETWLCRLGYPIHKPYKTLKTYFQLYFWVSQEQKNDDLVGRSL